MLTIVLPLLVKISVMLGLAILAVVVFIDVNVRYLILVKYHLKLSFFFGSMWFLPIVSTLTFLPLVKLGESLIKYFDQG